MGGDVTKRVGRGLLAWVVAAVVVRAVLVQPEHLPVLEMPPQPVKTSVSRY